MNLVTPCSWFYMFLTFASTPYSLHNNSVKFCLSSQTIDPTIYTIPTTSSPSSILSFVYQSHTLQHYTEQSAAFPHHLHTRISTHLTYLEDGLRASRVNLEARHILIVFEIALLLGNRVSKIIFLHKFSPLLAAPPSPSPTPSLQSSNHPPRRT